MPVYIYCPENSRRIEMSRHAHNNTNMLVLDDRRPPYTSMVAVEKWPAETIDIEGSTFRKGVWRKGPYTTEEKKLIGVEFEGVMCSAHKEDQWGLASVLPLVQGGQSIPYHFKNGNVLVLTPANITNFQTTWTTFRQSFFPMPE